VLVTVLFQHPMSVFRLLSRQVGCVKLIHKPVTVLRTLRQSFNVMRKFQHCLTPLNDERVQLWAYWHKRFQANAV
jgi:hypothetical protein